MTVTGYCFYHLNRGSFINNCRQYSLAGTSVHSPVRVFFSKSGNNNILTCPFCLHSRSLSPCSIVLSHFTRLSINLHPSFYIPYSASSSCTETRLSPQKMQWSRCFHSFHGGDEIFKRQSCLHLIACQHSHQPMGWTERPRLVYSARL